MFGHLVPCSGGKSIVLSRPSIYLGRRADVAREAPLGPETALCRLRLVEGWWHVDDLQSCSDLRINHERCHSGRLNPRDELAVGRARFRIDYSPPKDSAALLEQIAESVLFEDQPSKPSARESAKVTPSPTTAAAASARVTQSNLAALEQTAPQKSLAAEPGELLGRLVPLGGGRDYPLMKPNILVGRQPPCDVVLRTGTVSSKHCSLELIEGYWQVKDLGSRNGVRLDSAPCQEAWVFPDSRLSIADQRFRLDYTPQGEPPIPHPSQRGSLMAKAGLVGASLERLMAKQAQTGSDTDSERKRYELLQDL